MTIAVGATYSSPERIVEPGTMRTWAAVLRDPNPIHLDAAVVKAKGLGDRVINQGPANTAYVIDSVLSWFPGARIQHLSVRFLDNVFGGDVVATEGVVSAIGDAGHFVTCDVTLRAGARPVLAGAVSVRLPNPVS